MIKEKILKVGKLYTYKFSKDELKEIKNLTSFLSPDVSFSERCYCVINAIKEGVVCKECLTNKPKFLRISSGYREFCSNSCKNKWIYSNTDISNRISNTVKSYSYNLDFEERMLQQNKRLSTMIDKGIISSPEERSDYYNYKRMVWRFTNANNLNELKHLDKRGHISIDGAFQLDHRFSIIEGFKQNIPPYIIGSIHNLEMIPAKQNSSKKHKCSISKEKLIKTFFENINKNRIFGKKFNDYPERE